MSLFSLMADILYVGHSLVGPNLPPAVEATLRAMNAPMSVEAQFINGAPLHYNWDHGADTDGVNAREVLARGETDVLILTEAQPLATHLQWSGTPENIARFAALAQDANPDARVFVYETWPSLTSGTAAPLEGDPSGAVPWRARVAAELILWEDAATQASSRSAIGLIPAGQALGLLSDAIDAGQAPGLTSIQDMFSDDIHLNDKGVYFVALVHAAAITGRSPVGLPTQLQRPWPSRAGVISDELAAVMQRIAWQAVSAQSDRSATALPLIDPPGDASGPAAPLTDTAVANTSAIAAPAVDPPQTTSADPETAKAPQFAPITNPNLGLGLASVNDWSPQQPFLDVMKTARPWIGHLPGQWGGWDHDRLAAEGYLDADGWPTAIPPDLTGITTLILTDLADDAGGVAGRYDLTYAGAGTLVVEGRAAIIETAPGRITFDYTPGDGAVLITLTAIDAADPIRNITVVRQDRTAAHAAGAIFNPDWLARIKGVKLIRLMEWMAVTNATLTSSADRPRPGDYTWARLGVPIEVQIALANELQADPWFSIPHTADDALIAEWATLAHRTLDPALNAHVEFSNEVWNWQFTQARWAEDQGRARWGRDDVWVQFYALRAAEVMGIWSTAYGSDAGTRLTRIIATQTGWLGLEDQILTAPLVIAEGKPAPATQFDAYAITGYFSGRLGEPENLPMVQDWLTRSAADAEAALAAANLTGANLTKAEADAFRATHRHDTAIALAAQQLRDGSVSGDARDSLTLGFAQYLTHHAAVAAKHGLRLMMYEGGTHVVGIGPVVDDPAVTDFFTALNYSPQMGALYTELLALWSATTPEPFVAYVDLIRPSKWGSWGALRHLTDDNPRWQALATGCSPQC